MAQKSILFDVISNVLSGKSEKMYLEHTENEELWKTFSKFMLLRYMTMSYDSRVRELVIDNYITLERMPDKSLYKWLLVNIPKQRSGFIRYIK